MYRIEFSDGCLAKLGKIADVFDIHEVLASTYQSLRTNPRAFGNVPPLGELYFFKTVAYTRGELEIPAMTFYFKIYEDDRIVRIGDVNYRNQDGKWAY